MTVKFKICLFVLVNIGVAGLICFSEGPATAATPASTISYWKLDETEPTDPTIAGNYKDSVGSNDGASTGTGPTTSPTPSDPGDSTAAQVGGAMIFDGNATGIEVPADASFDWLASDSFSIESWVKPSTILPVGPEIFIGRLNPAQINPDQWLNWWVGLQSGTGVAAFRLQAKNQDGGLIEGMTDLTDDNWHHVVAIRDAANDSPPHGTISHWKLDETEPTDPTIAGNYKDSVGSNDGASTGTDPTTSPIPSDPGDSTAARVGGAMVFDGNATGIEVSADASFDWLAADSFSIECWVKPPLNPPTTLEIIIGRFDPIQFDPDNWLNWWIGIQPGSGKAAFRLQAKNQDGALVEGTSDLTDGAWHHIVAVRDADSGRNILYVDGVPEVSSPVFYDPTTGFDSPTLPLEIGHFNAANNHFAGSLDEIALYNRALTADEISAHHQAGLAGQGIETVARNYLYVDSRLEAVGVFEYNPTTGFDSPTLPLKIGHLDAADTHFSGTLDEIALFDDALSESEVAVHYQAGLAGQGIDTLVIQPEIIGTWENGIWYRDVAASKWTQMTADVTMGDIAAGDFSGDGKADVASSWDNLGLWYQDGVTLAWTKIDNLPPMRVTAGDVTGDGRDEVIGTWNNGIWYWNVATSTWTQMTAEVTIGDIAAGDFSGDGKADVASSWPSGLWYQDGATSAWTKIDNLPPMRVTAGDVTGN